MRHTHRRCQTRLLLAYESVEKHVEQHVAKLFAYVGVILLYESVTQLIDLFDSVGAQRLVGLLGVPRTLYAQYLESVYDTPECL